MNYIGRVFGNIKGFYSGINGATLTGAIDVVVVEQEDGTYKCSPFHVRFGKLGVFRSRETVVDIEVNGEPVPIRMKLGDSGEAFFVQDAEEDFDDENLATSPLPSIHPGISQFDKRFDLGPIVVSSPPPPPPVGLGLENVEGAFKELDLNKVEETTLELEATTTTVINQDGSGDVKINVEENATTTNPNCNIVDNVNSRNVNVSVNSNANKDKDSNNSSDNNTNMSKAEDSSSKSRKRRRKRKRNQGSKSDIKVDPSIISDSSTEIKPINSNININEIEVEGSGGEGETIFKMDEDYDEEDMKEDGKNLMAMDIVNLSSDSSDAGHNIKTEGKGERGTLGVAVSRPYLIRDFFSDTEVDANGNGTPASRPSTPIQSDSEYEISKIHKEGEEDEEVGKWKWGELPSAGPTTPAITPSNPNMAQDNTKNTNGGESKSESEEEGGGKKSNGNNTGMLAGMFSFMKSTKRDQQDEDASGIYLDDLNLENMDPEVASLYFPNFDRDLLRDSSSHHHHHHRTSKYKDEDVESGTGSSLPQSPAPGSSPKKGSMISTYMEDLRKQQIASFPNFESVSLCGNSLQLFEQSQVTYDELIENPEILINSSPDSIVVKIDGKLVPWAAALPQLFSTIFFKRPLPPTVYQKLIDQYMKKEDVSNPSIPNDKQQQAATAQNLASASASSSSSKKGYSSWFQIWGRKSSEKSNSNTDLNEISSSPPDSNLSIRERSNSNVEKLEKGKDISLSISDLQPSPLSLSHQQQEQQQPLIGSVKKSEPVDITPPLDIAGEATTSITININNNNNITEKEKYKKSLRLTSEQIAKLGLIYGQNEAIFSVTTAYQGTTVARCHIYLWRYDDRIVVSDIDGTITKSDVLGHILPIIGKDWAQSGVAQLFTQIQDNGYKMLYLSARAIGQASITRDYLRSIKQGDVTLPDGPLLLNPTSLMAAFHREVIEKKPEEFKIACLNDIRNLFSGNAENCFYAGYGNRINDVWAYRAVDVCISRIFTINHKGELRHALTNTFQSSYTSLVELADLIFPVYQYGNLQPQSYSQIDGFNTFEFWRDPLPLLPGINSSPSLTDLSKKIDLSLSKKIGRDFEEKEGENNNNNNLKLIKNV